MYSAPNKRLQTVQHAAQHRLSRAKGGFVPIWARSAVSKLTRPLLWLWLVIVITLVSRMPSIVAEVKALTAALREGEVMKLESTVILNNQPATAQRVQAPDQLDMETNDPLDTDECRNDPSLPQCAEDGGAPQPPAAPETRVTDSQSQLSGQNNNKGIASPTPRREPVDKARRNKRPRQLSVGVLVDMCASSGSSATLRMGSLYSDCKAMGFAESWLHFGVEPKLTRAGERAMKKRMKAEEAGQSTNSNPSSTASGTASEEGDAVSTGDDGCNDDCQDGRVRAQIDQLFSKQLSASKFGTNATAGAATSATQSHIKLVGKGRSSRFELVTERVAPEGGKQWLDKEDAADAVVGDLHSFYAKLYDSSKHDHLPEASGTRMIGNVIARHDQD
uniref:Uncharacterized protein n=1 Tax=Pyramimonas obovata TaxID=1411642 RepID=A0A7S0MYA4_9CHLO|mmetsp:Transcript_15451/g.33396  ORF Transcript_15451/g.33396 Transcript_15451/m.33396 type:complete len:390 (+) Transcript_15451:45-1214(+)